MVTKQSYTYYIFDVVLCLPLHIHNCVNNVLKHVLFHMHNIKVMIEEMGLPIRKILENTSFYPIMGQIKTKKLLLTELKIIHNVIVLQ